MDINNAFITAKTINPVFVTEYTSRDKELVGAIAKAYATGKKDDLASAASDYINFRRHFEDAMESRSIECEMDDFKALVDYGSTKYGKRFMVISTLRGLARAKNTSYGSSYANFYRYLNTDKGIDLRERKYIYPAKVLIDRLRNDEWDIAIDVVTDMVKLNRRIIAEINKYIKKEMLENIQGGDMFEYELDEITA